MQLFQVNAEIYDEDSMLGRETSYLTADNAVKAAYYARGMLRNICLECSLNLEELIWDHWSIFYRSGIDGQPEYRLQPYGEK